MITGLSASLGSDLAAAGGSLPFAPACATLYVSPENTISEVLIMKIDHIALCVNDLEAARDFFVRYFGAKPNGGYHNLCRQTDDDEQGGLTFEIDRRRFAVRLTAPYSDERRQVASELAKKNGLKGRV